MNKDNYHAANSGNHIYMGESAAKDQLGFVHVVQNDNYSACIDFDENQAYDMINYLLTMIDADFRVKMTIAPKIVEFNKDYH